ncbi:MAG: hypothetical protein LBC77_06990 [Spirochaetaceae bacterium]|jgi:hypothetical protein|nr:hypothetical protein [Spirochaetaceae bacterium]
MPEYTIRLNDGRLVHINTDTWSVTEIKQEVPVSESEKNAVIVEAVKELKKCKLPL